MSKPAILIEGLSKAFGWRKRVQAVNNISLEVPAGQVFGFLGPNGAGKTTTIRMLLDLIRPDSGQVFLYGQPVQKERDILKKVGAQVEGAMFYPFMSGRRNLEVLALTVGMEDYHERIENLLKQVKMTNRANRRVAGYSTGMKQRLGLAATLLHNPDLIILDEPTNGLDPQGIQEIRGFIRSLADEHGKTVFLSSHLLNEVEQVCDRVAIINQGRIIQQGTVEELIAGESRLRLEVLQADKAESLLQERWPVQRENGLLYVTATREDAPHIAQKLVENGIQIYEITRQRRTLEEHFLSVTGEIHDAV